MSVSIPDLEHHVESLVGSWGERGVSWLWRPYPERVPAGVAIMLARGDRVAHLGVDVEGNAAVSFEVVRADGGQVPEFEQVVLKSAHEAVGVLGRLADWVVSE